MSSNSTSIVLGATVALYVTDHAAMAACSGLLLNVDVLVVPFRDSAPETPRIHVFAFDEYRTCSHFCQAARPGLCSSEASESPREGCPALQRALGLAGECLEAELR